MRKYFLILLAIAAAKCSTTTTKAYDYGCPAIGKARPRKINAVNATYEVEFGGAMVNAARHHIIPYNLLRDFFNLAVGANPFGDRFDLFVLSRVEAVRETFEQNSTFGALPAGAFRDSWCPRFEADARMMAAFSWIPGNLFYGPPGSVRGDDPGSGFESMAQAIVGQRAFMVLRRTYINMLQYINNEFSRTLDSFDRILDDLFRISETRAEPYPYDASQWTLGRRGMVIRQLETQIGAPPPFQEGGLRRRLVRNVVPGDFTTEQYLDSALAVCDATQTQRTRCDAEEEYFVGTTKETWESARQICKSRNSDLVSIRSKTEQDALASYLTSKGYSKLMFWIGAKRRMEGEDVFYWVLTGLPMEFTYWRQHEPNNARGNENCVQIENKDLNYRWTDHVCETPLRFICKKR